MDLESHFARKVFDLVQAELDATLTSFPVLDVFPVPQQWSNVHPDSIWPQQSLDDFEVIDYVPSRVQEETGDDCSPLSGLVRRYVTPATVLGPASVDLFEIAGDKAEIRVWAQ